MGTILIVEDDDRTAREIAASLTDHGLASDRASTGIEAIGLARAGLYDAIILDRMLPGGLDGIEVLAVLRGTGIDTPVLVLSALSAVSDRVRGLRAGGDDYLSKPFDFLELTARVDALIRRPALHHHGAELVAGELHIDLLSRVVRQSGRVVDLLPREYALLENFVRNAGKVLTRTMIFEDVWGYRYDERTNVIDVHVAKLRRKLSVGTATDPIETVRGAGYRFRAA